ncbi:phosphate propanoyltransferase [Clostridium chauvoei]|uniref:Phosphate propanoyltransferase n=2 Tax=Clostridium chauvoei TaxID=46867 RepID=A0A1U6JC94_9CLOT|nr:phosphate propanoyltransferase [Clostridium chauvoei]ATD55056.1 phosphate propanoyltransferase [Clostridium chauvoei]ATD57270.1 phosphate propanoyltransferase [Clostridium chauvoei]MBX7279399.1 phosphate propanoyltransferase [Clostridium chauvoei]MBX7282515.1 phosphate propanoyltransferase [Clostridium chauvoei]MBX7285597.1 phosphate propanoyltransferase [Clostridium chauvoei]
MNQALIELITKAFVEEIDKSKLTKEKKVKIGVSARHIHLSEQHLKALFGLNYKLKIKKKLMGNQFAAEETVTIIGDNLRAIEKVRVLGPVRDKTQVEISLTDAITLGIKAPIRLSGDINNSEDITIVGPKGVVKIEEGCIVAKRHIHMTKEDYIKLGIERNIVSVRTNGIRKALLEDVDIRVGEGYDLEMHIDTDEANALNIKNGEFVEII